MSVDRENWPVDRITQTEDVEFWQAETVHICRQRKVDLSTDVDSVQKECSVWPDLSTGGLLAVDRDLFRASIRLE